MMLRLTKQKTPKGAEILMVTNPSLLLVLTSFIAKKRNWKTTILVHDVFPENLVVSGFIKSKTSFVYGIMNRIFNNAFNKMDILIVLGRDMQELFKRKKGNAKDIIIIENWADTENITAHPIHNNSKKKFLFAGNMGRLQGLELLLEALKNTENDPYIFTFVGSGALQNHIEEFILNHKVKHIENHGWIPREAQDKFMKDATIGVVSLKKGMYGLGVPSKFYNLLAAGKPIFYIGDVNSEIHLVLQQHEIGWFAEAGNLESITSTLRKIVNTNTDEINRRSKNARTLAQKEYSKEIILNKFNMLFKN